VAKAKLGVALAGTVYIPLCITLGQSFSNQICVLITCVIGELFDSVDLQMKYVEILILLQSWDAFMS